MSEGEVRYSERDVEDVFAMLRAIVDAQERGEVRLDAPSVNYDSLRALAHRLGWV